MCGICGIVDLERAPSRGALEQMTQVMTHRGPDDEGIEFLGPAALGFRRLSIIDLEGSHQPLSNEDDSVWVVFNGEIYNFQELRRDLVASGHRFRTSGDGETIVHLYEEHGLDFVKHLNGMFAIGLWDARRKRLVLVRDRMGIKPLYYARTPHGLVFASETKCLLQTDGIDLGIDPEAVVGYLNYNSVPGELTFFRGVRRLLPGTMAVFEDGDFVKRRYWDIDFTQKREWSDGDLQDAVEETLRDSIRLRMISDVPVGAFLSGGVDSSLVAAMMAQESSKPVEAFSVGYGAEGAYMNELEFAGRVARKYGMNHHELILDPDALLRDLDNVVWHLDEPCGDPAAFLTLALSRFSRERVTVTLSGLGGDELFAGYRPYLAARWQANYLRLPRIVRNGLIRPAVGLLPSGRTSKFANYARIAQKFVTSSDSDLKTFWANRVSYLPIHPGPIFAGEMSHALRSTYTSEAFEDYWGRVDGLDSPVDRVSYMDMRMYMVDQLLALQDKMSMAVSLEARVPMLDHRLVELAATIPEGTKLAGGKLKIVLKRLAEKHVPRECIYREKKGFAAPVEAWLKGPLRERVDDLLSPSRVRDRGILEVEFVEWVKDRFYRDGQDLSIQLYQLLLLETWLGIFADRHHVASVS